jgi:hypothetical protein
MGLSTTDTRIGIVSSSGVLRVTVPPKQSWLLILLEIVVISVGVKLVYGPWASMSLLLPPFWRYCQFSPNDYSEA